MSDIIEMHLRSSTYGASTGKSAALCDSLCEGSSAAVSNCLHARHGARILGYMNNL